MHLNSELLFKKYALQYFRPSSRVLEIGPVGFPSEYQTMVGEPSITWHTVDIQASVGLPLTYTASSEYTFPIADGAYDLVLSGQVIEHVRKIWIWMKEVARVCKTGGTVITLNPVSWPYHESPVDCWRAYPEGMKALYDDSSLEVMLCEWGSLEATRYRNRIPGRSYTWQRRPQAIASRVLGPLGFPVECAYDTITIGKKVDPRT